jgi:dTDP-4-amino-4,6-dideoxygalactose transaminase
MQWKVQLFKLNFDEREINAVAEVARSGWLTMGEQTKVFENRFSEFIGAGVQSIAVANGTAALHMALLALGVGPGDEVIIPSLTFVADINVVLMVGARPVLADCRSLEDWNVDPADIRRKTTRRTKAVMIVHYAGWPCDMDEISRQCRADGLALIEDSAHAIGAEWRGGKCGTFGDVACFSFFTNKNLSVGEGGMFVTRDGQLAQKGRFLRSHGMSTLTLDRHEGRAISYDVLQPGLNYRIDEFRAALGIIQLDKLEVANARRKAVTERYVELLKEVRAVSVPFVNYPDYTRPCFHVFPILLIPSIDRERVIGRMREQGIQTSIHYPAIQGFSAFARMGLGPTPVANDISSRELTLPLYPDMTTGEVDLVVSSLRKALE